MIRANKPDSESSTENSVKLDQNAKGKRLLTNFEVWATECSGRLVHKLIEGVHRYNPTCEPQNDTPAANKHIHLEIMQDGNLIGTGLILQDLHGTPCERVEHLEEHLGRGFLHLLAYLEADFNLEDIKKRWDSGVFLKAYKYVLHEIETKLKRRFGLQAEVGRAPKVSKIKHKEIFERYSQMLAEYQHVKADTDRAFKVFRNKRRRSAKEWEDQWVKEVLSKYEHLPESFVRRFFSENNADTYTAEEVALANLEEETTLKASYLERQILPKGRKAKKKEKDQTLMLEFMILPKPQTEK